MANILSFLLHALLLALVTWGLPHFTRAMPDAPESFTVELAPIAPKSNTAPIMTQHTSKPSLKPAVVKEDSKELPFIAKTPEPPEMKEPEIKEESKQEPEPPKEALLPPPEKIEAPLPKVEEKPRVEELIAAPPTPTKVPVPLSKPKIPKEIPKPKEELKPKPVKKPKEIESLDELLKTLDEVEDTTLPKAKKTEGGEKKTKKTPPPTSFDPAQPLSQSEKAYIQRSLENKWNILAGGKGAKSLAVILHIKLNKDGSVLEVTFAR